MGKRKRDELDDSATNSPKKKKLSKPESDSDKDDDESFHLPEILYDDADHVDSVYSDSDTSIDMTESAKKSEKSKRVSFANNLEEHKFISPSEDSDASMLSNKKDKRRSDTDIYTDDAEDEEMSGKKHKKKKKNKDKDYEPPSLTFSWPHVPIEPHEEEDEEEEMPPAQLLKSSPTKQLNGHSNLETSGIEDDKYAVYLIRKPIEVSLEELKCLKLKRKGDKLKAEKLHTEVGIFSVKSAESNGQMIHVPAASFTSIKDTKKIKPGNIISTCIDITRIQTTELGDVYEEGDAPAAEAHPHGGLKAIKKDPILMMDQLKQRLKAYGVHHKKSSKRRSLKNLMPG